MKRRQFTTPLLIRGGKTVPLSPKLHDDSVESEELLQKLLFDHPSLIPIEDIEPAFGELITTARELSTNSGPIDLLFIDNLGHLVLVETKLWRNPESRRKVVGQIIDYASDLATWSYADLVEGVREAMKRFPPAALGVAFMGADPLVALARASEPETFNESRFVDAVTQNLARGRFLMVIVGDGIREGVEQMADFLQNQAHLGFHLALIELAMFRVEENSDDFFVQPRVVAETREITRAVVEIRFAAKPGDVVVRPAETGVVKTGSGSLSQKEYFEQLSTVSAELPDLVATVLAEAPRHGLSVEWGRAGPMLKYRFADDSNFVGFGQFTSQGKLQMNVSLSERCKRLGLPSDLWGPYYSAILPLLGNGVQIVREEDGWWFADKDKGHPNALTLLQNRDKWFVAIDEMIRKLQVALKSAEE